MTKQITKPLVLLFLFGLSHCSGNNDDAIVQTKEDSIDPSELAALVDGVPIYKAQVQNLIESGEDNITVNQALEALIRNELLAAEAARRGFGSAKAVQDTKKTALARAVLNKRIAEGITASGIDKGDLRKYYELKKERFVHGVMRRPNHLLVKTDDKKPDDEARQLAEKIYDLARDTKNQDDFKMVTKLLDQQDRAKVTFEQLPPFDKDSKVFVEPFVNATFEIEQIGGISKPFKTSFGWHVVYFAEEIEAINRSFDEVWFEIANEVLPTERKGQAKLFLDKLVKEGDVFIYEEALSEMDNVF